MPLTPLNWSGNAYTLRICRHWNTLFAYATICEIRAPRMSKLLPEGAGHHILGLYSLVKDARDYFDDFNNFWRFSCTLCDQYCDFFVMERPLENNYFNLNHSRYLNDHFAVQEFAKNSRGYIGPENWNFNKF